MPAPTVSAITFDCRDVATQARFWSKLLDQPLTAEPNEFFASIGEVHDPVATTPTFLFLHVDGERGATKNPVHIDLHADDIPATIDRTLALGAELVAEFNEHGIQWATLRDPEGNLFDIGRRSTDA